MRTVFPFLLMMATSVATQGREELDLVREVFNQIQPQSIAENREYCGYLGFDAGGQLVSTQPVRGRADECQPEPESGLEIIASWHTHAGFDAAAWCEGPSVNDIEADEEEGIDGYVSTPGGRVWYVDTQDMVVSQICGLGCVISDPAHEVGVDGVIAQSYTYEELLAREAEQ